MFKKAFIDVRIGSDRNIENIAAKRSCQPGERLVGEQFLLMPFMGIRCRKLFNRHSGMRDLFV